MSDGHQKRLLVGRFMEAISDYIPVMGTSEFIDKFLDAIRLSGAAQVTAFAYQPAKADCILSHNFLSEEKGGVLATAYLSRWFLEDPLFERAIALENNQCVVERLDDFRPLISSQYLSVFFEAAGFRTKIAVLVAQGSLRMVLNLYFERDIKTRGDSEVLYLCNGTCQLIGRTLASHFLQLNPPQFPLPLTDLSERERQVCIGMLAGKKAEIIAEEVGIGLSSVVTYRQRAYQKLGISSRGELFSICRPWEPKPSHITSERAVGRFEEQPMAC